MTDNVINMFGNDATPAPADGEDDVELLKKEFKYRVAEYLKLLAEKIEAGDLDFSRMVILDTGGDAAEGTDDVNVSCFGLVSSIDLIGILELAKFVAMNQQLMEER